MIVIPNPLPIMLSFLAIIEASYKGAELSMAKIVIYMILLVFAAFNYKSEREFRGSTIHGLQAFAFTIILFVVFIPIASSFLTNSGVLITMALSSICITCFINYLIIPEKKMKRDRATHTLQMLFEGSNLIVLLYSYLIVVFNSHFGFKHDVANIIVFLFGSSVYLASRMFNEDSQENFLVINYRIIVVLNLVYATLLFGLGSADLYLKYIKVIRACEILAGMNWALPLASYLYRYFQIYTEEEKKTKPVNYGIIIFASVVMWYAVVCFLFRSLGGSLLPWDFHWPQVMIAK